MSTPVSLRLQNWFESNKRELPWRQTTDPYRIWLSEVILQQTRVDQGLPYYQKFVEHYPTVFDLAQSTEDEVLKHWQGLGYYSRGRNLLKCAREIANIHNGTFPSDYKTMIKLPGIGDYTASAILSFAYQKPHPVLDGNVFRFLSRLYGDETPINTTQGSKIFKALAEEILDGLRPDRHNQAIMEFGAIHCTPKNPKCTTCPFSEDCLALRHRKVDQLPVKIKAKPRRKRHFNYIVFLNGEHRTLIHQRDQEGIWAGLYQFPLFETPGPTTQKDIQTLLNDHFDTSFERISRSSERKHILSHQEIFAVFWIVQISSFRFPRNSNIFEVGIEELKTKHAMPVLVANYLEELRLNREDVN